MLLRPSRTTRSSGFARSCAASFCRSAIGCSMPPQPYSQIRCSTRGIAEMVDSENGSVPFSSSGESRMIRSVCCG